MGYYIFSRYLGRSPTDVVKRQGLPQPTTQEEANRSTMGDCRKNRAGGPSPCLKSSFLVLSFLTFFLSNATWRADEQMVWAFKKHLKFNTVPPEQLKLLTQLFVNDCCLAAQHQFFLLLLLLQIFQVFLLWKAFCWQKSEFITLALKTWALEVLVGGILTLEQAQTSFFILVMLS